MKTNRTQAQFVSWHEAAKQKASEAMPSFHMWEICPNDKYARTVAKRYNFKGFLIRPGVLDGEKFFALYIPR